MEQETLGRYRILGELGRGAMGTVYRALDPVIDRQVAIKTLLPTLPEEAMKEVRERFLREARSAGRLSHPNIVTIYDVGEQDGIAYIAMELLQGHSLQAILRHPQRLAFNTIANIIAQVADALDHAQRFSVVHRDVKPANVMVDSAARAKLTDFGVAYVPSSTMTQAGMALGSPRYMSPEQVLGHPVDPRSDIFSLGVVLYEMLARRTPFEQSQDATVFALMNRIATAPHEPLRNTDPLIPEAFEHIVERALAKDPAKRYQRAAEMAQDLRDFRNLPRARLSSEGQIPPVLRAASASGTPEDELVRTQLINDLDKFVEQYDRAERERLRQEIAASQGAPELAPAMRAAAEALGRLARELNEATPSGAGPYEYIYVGKLPEVRLSQAELEARHGERDLPERIVLRYRVTPANAARVTLAGEDIARCEQYLQLMRVAFETRVLAKDEQGRPARAEIVVTGSLPCEISLRADYRAGSLLLELTNVRRLGRVQQPLTPAQLERALPALARYIIGDAQEEDMR